MNYGLEKPKLPFLESLGLRRLCEKIHPSKLEPKTDKCIFIGHPKQLGIPPISDLEAKVIVSRNGSFLEKKISLKRIESEDGGDLMRLLNRHYN